MLDVLFTICQLLAVLAVVYGVYTIAQSPRTFRQALALADEARSNHYAAVEHRQVKGEDAPVRGRPSRNGPRASGNLNGLGGAAA